MKRETTFYETHLYETYHPCRLQLQWCSRKPPHAGTVNSRWELADSSYSTANILYRWWVWNISKMIHTQLFTWKREGTSRWVLRLLWSICCYCAPRQSWWSFGELLFHLYCNCSMWVKASCTAYTVQTHMKPLPLCRDCVVYTLYSTNVTSICCMFVFLLLFNIIFKHAFQ